MIRLEVGEIGGEKLWYCQVQTPEEIQTLNLPKGLCGYWEKGSERIYSPFQVMKLIQDEISRDNSKINKFVSHDNVQAHYRNLMIAQRQNIVKALKKTKEQYQTQAVPAQVISEIDERIKTYEGEIAVDSDGVYRPKKEEVIRQAGGIEELRRFYTDKQLLDLFGIEPS